MKAALLRYRVMANVIGVLLIVLVLIGVPLKYLSADASRRPQSGRGWITKYLGMTHGWLYMVVPGHGVRALPQGEVVLSFTVVTLLCGTIPILSFWAEHRATRHVEKERRSGTGAATTR